MDPSVNDNTGHASGWFFQYPCVSVQPSETGALTAFGVLAAPSCVSFTFGETQPATVMRPPNTQTPTFDNLRMFVPPLCDSDRDVRPYARGVPRLKNLVRESTPSDYDHLQLYFSIHQGSGLLTQVSTRGDESTHLAAGQKSRACRLLTTTRAAQMPAGMSTNATSRRGTTNSLPEGAHASTHRLRFRLR
jgi:hypothetical protein